MQSRIAIARKKAEPAILASFLGVGLGLREQPIVLAIAGVVAVFAVISARLRVLIIVLGVSVLAGAPWILTPALAGLAWLAWPSSPTDARPELRQLLGVLRVRQFGITILVGAFCGAIGAVAVAIEPVPGFRASNGSQYPVWMVAMGVAILAATNAFGEEVIWRGALLRSQEGWNAALTFGMQAASFGLAHLEGTPSGMIGVALTALFSCIALRFDRVWGLTASIAIHAVADALVFVEVYRTQFLGI
jgi:membrane protease YdiL (CAAX protease family)